MTTKDKKQASKKNKPTAKVQAVKKNSKKENTFIMQLEKDLGDAKQKVEELTDAYKRTAADLQNFKRRSEEEQKNLVNFANTNLVLEILPIVDNFERAIEHKQTGTSKEWLDGILQIYNQFQGILEKQGVEKIKSLGKKLDPNLHEAMLHSEGEDGIIVQELEKGYTMKGKVIRPAKVSVGNGQTQK